MSSDELQALKKLLKKVNLIPQVESKIKSILLNQDPDGQAAILNVLSKVARK